MIVKNLTKEDADRFWMAFDKRHPELGRQVPNRVFMEGAILSFPPKLKDGISYSIFERFLKRWLGDNGFTDKEPDLVFVAVQDSPTNDVRAIDTASISKIEKADTNRCKLFFKDSDQEKYIFIKEDYEKFTSEVYIF